MLGSISTVPVGGTDDKNFNAHQSDIDSVINYSPLGTSFPKYFANVGVAGMIEGDCGRPTFHPTINIPNNALFIENNKGNTERDLYKINLLGKSFEVFIKPITNQIFFNGEKCLLK